MMEGAERKARILLVEDSDIDAELICRQLERSTLQFDLERAARRSDFEQLLKGPRFDIVLSDYSLPDFDGLSAMTLAREVWPDVPVVLVSGVGGEELATDAFRRGATDYVLKRNLARLPGSIARALAEAGERAQRRAAESAMIKSEANMRLALDAAELGLWQYGMDNGLIEIDERCQRLCGRGGQVRIPYGDFIACVQADDRDALHGALQAALAGTASAAFVHECRIVGADGSLRWAVLRGQKLATGNGGGARLSGVMQDLTATRVLEQRQRHSEVLFRLASQATGLGVWELGPTINELWIDDGYRRIAGLPKGESPGYHQLIQEVIHPDDRDRLGLAIDTALAGDGQGELELEHRIIGRDDRQLRWLAVKGRRVAGIDGRMRLVGTVRDVTEQRALQQALRESNADLELRVAERTRELTAEVAERGRVEDTLRQMQRLEAVGQLTSGVAHDFNNLLTVVLSNISLIGKLLGQQASVDERVTKRLASMREAANRGALLTKQLLAFSRRQRLEPQDLDLNEIVRGMRDLLHTSIGPGVHFTTELSPQPWLARVDRTQFELIVLNLAINARDAMNGHGDLVVRSANVSLLEPPARPEEPEPGEYVTLSVSDNGTGMTPEVLAKAFEPFFTTKEVGKGSGLGLAQVFGFAKQSGGGVRIDTSMGAGTTVQVYMPRGSLEAMPVEPALPPDTAPRHRATPAGASQSLLLVDDDASVRDVTAALLRLQGFRVLEADSGQAALAVAAQEADIDLVIADFAMPQMNGVQMAKLLHAQRPGLPVLFVTGYADLAALADVPEDFIVQKPVPEGELMARLRRLLRRSASVKAAP